MLAGRNLDRFVLVDELGHKVVGHVVVVLESEGIFNRSELPVARFRVLACFSLPLIQLGLPQIVGQIVHIDLLLVFKGVIVVMLVVVIGCFGIRPGGGGGGSAVSSPSGVLAADIPIQRDHPLAALVLEAELPRGVEAAAGRVDLLRRPLGNVRVLPGSGS